MSKVNSIFKQIGPGLLYAGAAVGVSHLVQSTRAGAEFGFELIWIIILAHLVKYPFFLMGPLYADQTGKTILDGYKKQGRWALVLFAVLTASTMFAVIAAISIVTGGLAEFLFNVGWSAQIWSMVLLIGCMLVLFFSGYSFLDKAMKWVVIVLSLATVITFLFAIGESESTAEAVQSFDWSKTSNLFFLIAFFGWMPAPMDISIWHSVWRIEKNKSNTSAQKPSNMDFHIGYFGTAILAFLFLGLGAFTLYGSGMELEAGGVAFSAQLIGVYTSLIGQWTLPIIGLAAVVTMFSTSITCLDAFPRSLAVAFELMDTTWSKRINYKVLLLTLTLGAGLILIFVLENMRQLVDFATTISFLTTPLLALLNYRSFSELKKTTGYRLPSWLKALSIASLVFLAGFAVYFLVVRFI
ncbi:divalent metal cation transporter [Salibacteraceae bacterium]|nr:divalent metal cation transporter [Salibacteraceae bacterium]